MVLAAAAAAERAQTAPARWRRPNAPATSWRCGSRSTRWSTSARAGGSGPRRHGSGSALQIKPILTLGEEITPVERVRTRRRAFERMVDYARQRHDDGADGWVVQHIQDPETARRLVEQCRELFGTEPIFVSEVGPVIGAHVGPGLIGTGGVPRALLS